MPNRNDLNSLFETPKKTRLTIICSLVALITLGAIAAYVIHTLQSPGADAPPLQSETVSDAPSESDTSDESEAPTQTLVGIVPTLTIDEARALALAEAGVSESEADITREALAEDNGIWVYEFRFRTEQAQYEYKLNANTGDVRSLVKETFAYPSAEVSTPPASESVPVQSTPQPSAAPRPAQSAAPIVSQPPATPAPTPTPSTSMYIGMDKAKAAALEHAGLSASEVMFTHAGMDRDHGTMVYEIEFRQGRAEYEYEIDATTGRVVSYEWEGVSTAGQSTASAAPATPSAPAQPTYISTDRAKTIALGHAGLSASDVTFTKAEMDWEHGTMVYEIEFRQGRVEYDYEIDAITGNILDYERDMD